ncbi:MAG: D-aminoacylase [Candidatus Glassbacteria bacterium]|nr:D-aminoacylase [Candidatus Glassbacteria bacterium]
MNAPFSRRDFLKSAALAALGPALYGPPEISAAPSFDLVVKGGTVLDGTGAPAWQADLGIRGDTIAAVGEVDPGQGRRVLLASGLQVCPGFIDIHTHSDGEILVYPAGESRVYQGITTELTGNCGGSAAPLTGVDAEKRRRQLLEDEEIQADWTDTASYFARVEQEGISLNHAMLLGQGTLRANAIGAVDRPLSAGELQEVVRAVEEGMDQGAMGLSTGLEYVPGSYTPTEELVAMARAVARRGGLYASHIRDEGAGLLEAVNEQVEIGRLAGVRVEISHFKAAGRPNWNKQAAALSLVEAARSAGVEVLADAYPYPVYSTSLTIYLPAWAREGSEEDIVARVKDKDQRSRIRAEVEVQVHNDPGDYDLVVITRVKTDKNKPLIGKNLAEVARGWNLEPVDAVLRLLVEEQTRVEMVGYGMAPENVEMVLAHPLVMVGSDGHVMAPRGKMDQARPHPRSYGTCPRVLGYYCRERKIFDLPTAVKKMTSMPADQMGLSDRGRIARGMKADLVVFDAATVRDTATFQDPHQYPAGIGYVLVNGVPVVEQGKHTGARPGRVLRKS